MASGTTAPRPRGRLPQRVYWVRRAVVLVVAAALVLGVARLVGGFSSDDQPTAEDKASNVASASGKSSASDPAQVGPVAPSVGGTKRKQADPSVPLLAPQGECSDDEVTVMPKVGKAAAGGPITLVLELVGTQPACTYKVSSSSVVLKVTSGADRIWSSQDCPRSIPTGTVVVRSGTPVDVPVTWSGRRSDDECSTHTSWALPGFYHVYAAAIGSTPTDLQFEITLPDRPVVTRTAKPKPTRTATPTPRPAKSSTTKGKQSKCGGDNAAGSC